MPRKRKSLRYYHMTPAWVRQAHTSQKEVSEYSVWAEWPSRLDLQHSIESVLARFGGERGGSGSGMGHSDVYWLYTEIGVAISAAKQLSRIPHVKALVQHTNGDTIWGLDGV